MRITIELEATAEINIDLNEESIIEVMKDYNGDFSEWAKHNYSDWMDFNDFNVNFESCNYDEDEAKKLLEKSKDVLGLDENFNIDKQIAMKTMLKKCQCDVPNINSKIEEFNIDVDLVSKAINYVDFNNPKYEINYILLNKDTISATDTRSLIKITSHKYDTLNNVLFPPYFLEPLKDGGKVYLDEDSNVFLKYKNYWFSGYYNSANSSKFPPINRILMSEKEKINAYKIPMSKFSSNSITQQYENDTNPKNLIKFKVFDKECFINEKYYNDIIDIHNDIEIVLSAGYNCPVHFEGKNIKIAIMPYIID